MSTILSSGTMLLAGTDQAGLHWLTGQLGSIIGARLSGPVGAEPIPASLTGPELVAAHFDTSYDAVQAVERLMAAASDAGVPATFAVAAYGWGSAGNPVDAVAALTLARALLAAAPTGAAVTCGSTAMVAGPLLTPGFELVLAQDIVAGHPGPVFRIQARAGDGGEYISPCIEWARRDAGHEGSREAAVAAPGAGRFPRLVIARAAGHGSIESAIAGLALQAHAGGGVVLRADRQHRNNHGGILLLDLMTQLLPDHGWSGAGGPWRPASASGFARIDELEAWLQSVARKGPTTIVVPDPAALDDISRVLIERLLQDDSLPGFSVITSQPGESVSEELGLLMSRVRRGDTLHMQVSSAASPRQARHPDRPYGRQGQYAPA